MPRGMLVGTPRGNGDAYGDIYRDAHRLRREMFIGKGGGRLIVMLIGMLIGRGQMPIGRGKDADRNAYRKGEGRL